MSPLGFDKVGAESELIKKGCEGGGNKWTGEQDAQREVEERGCREM